MFCLLCQALVQVQVGAPVPMVFFGDMELLQNPLPRFCDIFEGFPNVSVHCTILLNVDLTELYIFYCLLFKKQNAF